MPQTYLPQARASAPKDTEKERLLRVDDHRWLHGPAIGIVSLGFVLGGLVAVKEIGVGLAVAVLLDVTVVRGLLLPATMSLLGRWNWWRPGTTTAVPEPAPRVPVG